MSRIDQLKALLKNDAAKAKVQQLNKLGKAAISGAVDGDQQLAAYRTYVRKFYELKELYPHWEERLNQPIEYSRFVLDYDERIYNALKAATADLKEYDPAEVYAFKMHGINLRSISVLQEKLIELKAGSEWGNPEYFRTHIREAYQLLRQYFPNDDEYDEVFSPKEVSAF